MLTMMFLSSSLTIAVVVATAMATTASASTSSTTSTTRVVGGQAVASRQAYPFFVQWQDHCGASLIWEDMILTAAHCNGANNPLDRVTYIGGTIRNTGLKRTMVKRILHPQWNANLMNEDSASNYNEDDDHVIAWDVMVAKLNQSVHDHDEDNGVVYTPVQLNAQPDSPRNGQAVTAMGYGRLSHTGMYSRPDRLRHVEMQAFSTEDCQTYYGNTRIKFQSDSMLCVGVDGGGKSTCQGTTFVCILDDGGIMYFCWKTGTHGSCRNLYSDSLNTFFNSGDSGGPLLIQEDDASNWTQVGVVSWGTSCFG